jgi:hypothetical protein
METLALGQGDRYVFATAPAKCAADALQVMFNSTSGKSAGYAMALGGKKLEEYASSGVKPMTVAMRINPKKDECTGLVLGFDWSKAFEATGVKPGELSPRDGKSDPMFWVARVKMSREMARLPMEQLKGYDRRDEIVQRSGCPGRPNRQWRPVHYGLQVDAVLLPPGRTTPATLNNMGNGVIERRL